MATSMQGVTIWSALANDDLSGSLFLFAKVVTGGLIDVATGSEPTLGIIVEGDTEGKPVSVQVDGIGKVKLNTTLAAGVLVLCNSDGTATTYTTGLPSALLLQGGNAGDIVPCVIF